MKQIEVIGLCVLICVITILVNFFFHVDIIRQDIEIKTNAEDFVNQHCQYKPQENIQTISGVQFFENNNSFDWKVKP